MAYPPAYTRAFSFTDWETLHPDEPKPGPQLDAEYDGVSNALTATQTNLALIQRADGALANGSVGVDQLDPTVFDGIADGITDDAQAAADAAAASASSAAGSAASATASAATASTDASVAAGYAAQAGVSQSIAQGAADDAEGFRDNADDAATAATTAANEAQGSFNSTQAAVQRSFEWAELLTGPVLPAPPGWPEAVDDGMFSSKWWAIRARDYNATETIDLGTAGTDVGNAFDIWDAIPGNDLGVGQTYATWGSPTQTYVLIDRSNPSDPASWQNITGGPGPPGPANNLTVGTVTTGVPGSAAVVTITGASPNQVLNLSIPRGDIGPQGVIGPAGPPNALAIGTVNTVPDGTPSSATITGTAPTQTLNLTLTAGPQGIQGIQGIQGPVGPAVNLANPTGLIGLTAINGVATTAPRSDSIHALDQGIAPVWTAGHIFALSGTSAAPSISLESTQPVLMMRETGQGTDAKSWEWSSRASVLTLRAINDANNLSATALTISRSGIALTNFNFGSTDNPTYNFLGTGLTKFNGPVTLESTNIPRLGFLKTGQLTYYIGGDGTASNDFTLGLNASTLLRVNTLGQLLGINGTSGQPSFSFISDPDTGMWLAAPNAAEITAGGVRVAQFNSTAFIPLLPTLTNVDGTAAAPSYSFNNDPDTGIWHDTADSLSFTIGGVNRVLIRAVGLIIGSGVIFAQNGTAALPAYTFLNDQDTGMYSGGANFLSFAVGGVDRFVMSSLQIYCRGVFWNLDASAANPAYSFESDNDTGMYHSAADEIGFSAGGLPQLLINPAACTLIPRLAVQGTITSSSVIYSVVGSITTKVQSFPGGAEGIVGTESNHDLTIRTNNSERLRFNAAGTGAAFSIAVSAPSFTATSSRAIKRETGKPTHAADILSRLRPILYRLLAGSDAEQIGLVAEEVHEVCPQLSDGKTVAYDRIALLLLADWQDSRAAA